MINEANYSQQNIERIGKYFLVNECNIDEKIIKKHLYCLGLLESFSKIGMNYLLIGNMAVYLMTDNNLYLPDNLEIAVNRQDFLDDYLSSANSIFTAYEKKIIEENENYLLYEYSFQDNDKKIISIYLSIKLEDHLTNDVISVAINKPFLIQEERIYRSKVPYYEALFAQALFCFSPNELESANFTNDPYSLYLVKKLIDASQLYPYLKRFDIVIDCYEEYFERAHSINNELKLEYFIYDAYNSLINFYCKGTYRPEYFHLLKKGINEIQKLKLNEIVSIENIFQLAAYPLLACACIYQKTDCLLIKIKNHKPMNFFNYTKINNIKKYNKKAFNIVCQAIEIFDRLDLIEKINNKK